MFRRNIVPILVLLFICFFILKPATVSEGAFNGLKIWVNNIVPFLFPMSVLSNILLQYNFLYSLFERMSFISNKLLKNKYALIPFFISFVSGYPSGAMTINTMSGCKRINEKEANYLTAFTNNCSFQFIAGAVSFSMLGDFQFFKYIAIPHLVGAIFLSFLMINKESERDSSKTFRLTPVPFHNAFSTAIYKSVTGILSVGGVIVIFSVFSSFLNDSLSSAISFLSLNAIVKDILFSILVGSLEITNGCSIISSSLFVPLQTKLIIINFLISFSGMSVIFQTIAVINEFNFDIKNYVFYKFIHGIISSLLCIVMFSII
jgi:sporulation integral membrane protein YlbJ